MARVARFVIPAGYNTRVKKPLSGYPDGAKTRVLAIGSSAMKTPRTWVSKTRVFVYRVPEFRKVKTIIHDISIDGTKPYLLERCYE